MSYQKLVRDKIPEIIKSNGEEPIIKILSDFDYKKELEKKLREEMQEVLESEGINRIDELADLLEVMMSLASLEGKKLEDIIQKCDDKRNKRGGFKEKIYLEGVRK